MLFLKFYTLDKFELNLNLYYLLLESRTLHFEH